MKVSAVLAGKARSGVVTIAPDATVRDLVALLAENNIGAVVVSSDGRTLEGIVSERDVVRRLVGGAETLEVPVSEIMSREVRSAAEDDDLDQTRRLMTEGRFRHLPILRDGALVGLVSIGDVVKSHIEQVEFERDQLDSYVHQQ